MLRSPVRVASSESRVPARAPATSCVRRGFTLVELLVVSVIMLLLAAAAAPVALTLLNGRSLREASSTVQSVLAGARDRASAAREARGVRLIPDSNNPSIVRELRLIRPSAPVMAGSAIVVDAVWNAGWDNFTVPFPPDASGTRPVNQPTLVNSSWPNGTPPSPPPLNYPQYSMAVLLGCNDAPKLRSLPFRVAADGNRVYFGVIRLATSGQLLGFSTTDALILNAVGGEPCPLLRLDQPLTRPYPYDVLRPGQLPYSAGFPAGYNRDYLATVGDNYTIPIGSVELEGEAPILLPNGVVVDLGFVDLGDPTASPPVAPIPPDPSGFRLSRLAPEYTNWDIMFSPTGAVLGNAAADAHIFLWLREEAAPVEDLTVANTVAPSGRLRAIPTNNTGNHSIVAIVSRTGLIRSVEPNFGRIPTDPDPTMDVDGNTFGTTFPYWDRRNFYDLFYSELNAPDGGETGL
jgi:prepilin-type N-terminal cleavage/methylation domain-containing protein